MVAWSLKKNAKPGDAGWRLRRADRFGGATVSCALGEIRDISSTGLRVSCKGKPPVSEGGIFPIRLKFGDGSLQLTTQVRWVKRKGLKRFEIGLKFIQLKPGMPRVLEAIARFGMARAAKHMDDPTTAGPGSAGSKRKEQAKPSVDIDLPNYYKALGLTHEATDAQIKAQYRKLAVQFHPDRSEAPDAMARFEAINEAYHVLSDARQRRAYASMAR